MPGPRQRRGHRADELGRQALRRIERLACRRVLRRAAARSRIALAVGDLRFGVAGHAHGDGPQLAVAPFVRRVVAEHVVRAVLLDDAIERRVEVVAADERDPAGLLGELAQVLL